MIIVKKVITKKQQKEFLEFPLSLYKDNPYFVPSLYMMEKDIFKKIKLRIIIIVDNYI